MQALSCNAKACRFICASKPSLHTRQSPHMQCPVKTQPYLTVQLPLVQQLHPSHSYASHPTATQHLTTEPLPPLAQPTRPNGLLYLTHPPNPHPPTTSTPPATPQTPPAHPPCISCTVPPPPQQPPTTPPTPNPNPPIPHNPSSTRSTPQPRLPTFPTTGA